MNKPESHSSFLKTQWRSSLGPPEPSLIQKQGDCNIKIPGFDFHPIVFLTSGGLIVFFVLFTLIFRETAESTFASIQNLVATATG